MRRFYDVDQNTDEWFELRLGKITASEFDTLTSSPDSVGYKKLVAQKAYERMFFERIETYSNAWMQRGHDLEPMARLNYMQETMTNVLSGGFWALGNAGCSPDGLIGDDGILEIKCPALHTHYEYLKKNRIPPVYFWQVQGQLYVTGSDYCDFMSFFPGVKTLIVREHPELIAQEEIKTRLTIIEDDIEEAINYLTK